jgi:hypothetical protein
MASRRTFYVPVMIVAAVLMACAVVMLAASEKAEATFPAKYGRIANSAFPLDGGLDDRIYTMDPGGGAKTKLTRGYPTSYSLDGNRRIAYTLDFIHSGRIAKRFGQVLYEPPWDFYRIGVCRRLAKSRVRPQLLSHQRQSIREGRAAFAIPRCLPDCPHASHHSPVGQQGNDREQPQQRRSGPPDC